MGCSSSSQSCPCPHSKPVPRSKALLWFLIALVGGGLVLVFNELKHYEEKALNAQSLGMVFVLGFLTGLHCISMCGGFMMSYVRFGKQKGLPVWQVHLHYSLAKTVSYTILGAVFGWLGSIVHFSSNLKASISILGGVFLLYLGARSFGMFKNLQGFSITHYVKHKSVQWSHPIWVGLLNGLMIACAPLQALYLVAAGVGSPLKGAIMLAVFGVGTLPVFMFYGVLASSFNRFQARWADYLTTTIIVVFGMLMINRGMAQGGYTLSSLYAAPVPQQNIMGVYTQPQVLHLGASPKGWSKSKMHYQYGRKVRLEIKAASVSHCNQTISIPKLGIECKLKRGLNVIEFDPGTHQQLVYTCAMGMMTGRLVAR